MRSITSSYNQIIVKDHLTLRCHYSSTLKQNTKHVNKNNKTLINMMADGSKETHTEYYLYSLEPGVQHLISSLLLHATPLFCLSFRLLPLFSVSTSFLCLFSLFCPLCSLASASSLSKLSIFCFYTLRVTILPYFTKKLLSTHM